MTSYQIGCDIGGTFTDIVVLSDQGAVFTDKADTTPDDLSVGVTRAIENVAGRLDIDVQTLLGSTSRFINGTTSVTNCIAELRGARVGLIVSRGFRDTLRIARCPRNENRDHHLQRNMPDIVPRDCIVEVNERVDRKGKPVVELTEAEAERAVEELVAKGAESIAVCLLWSFANPAHEQLIRTVVERDHPDLFVSLSTELYPMIREYERMVTTVLNAFTGLRVAEYTESIEDKLQGLGLKVPVSMMQSFGGTLSPEEARSRPITLVDSGPVGGVVGANQLAKRMGIANVITGDMGGTSFDVSVIPDNEYTVTQRVMLREFLTGLSKIDVVSVGAGGGSIAALDARGVPQVGPRSAGADPGPVCYGRGGEHPTVTDASVALGIIDPDSFLGGRRSLDLEAARAAIARDLAEPLGISIEEGATAVYRLVTATMSNAVRGVTVERGRDPREFAFFAFGGALPVFGAAICEQMGIGTFVVPANSAVFSAAGLLGTDDIRNVSRSVFWAPGQSTDVVNATLADLESQAVNSLLAAGHSREGIKVQRSGDFKFAGQLFELTVPIPDAELTESHFDELAQQFPELYEAEYGEGTAWEGMPVVLLAARVVATAETEKHEARGVEEVAADGGAKGTRSVYLPTERDWVETSVYEASGLSIDTPIDGPAIVEHRLTTTLVPPNWSLRADELRNLVLEKDGAASGTPAATAAATAG